MCISCDDSAVCCLLDDNEEKTEDCADCSNADFDNFDPDQCDPIDERFWFKKDDVEPLVICNPDNPSECISCDDSAVCCLSDDNGVTEDCADCSEADFENFDPDQCDPIDERFWFKEDDVEPFVACNPDDPSECLTCDTATG
jgi:hypothetical protein